MVSDIEKMKQTLSDLVRNGDLPDQRLKELLAGDLADGMLFDQADRIRREVYGDKVYIRGLIEISNYCRNDCFYCGIRRSNSAARRYRLDAGTILDCCRKGYRIGFRTFVLQGGEDPFFTDDILLEIVKSIHEEFPDCAITLSLGERSKESYGKLFEAGARRYLLRHEAASRALYNRLHPEDMSFESRMRCLRELKDIGFQTGAGMMVGAPTQRVEDIIADIRFMKELEPDMIGIGPFIHQSETPFGDCPDGSSELTVRLISILRLMFPYALIPSTTALASIDPEGRIKGFKAGANVVMPNLSPGASREKYSIYDNKAATGLESAQGMEELKETVSAAGYRIVTDIGDVARLENRGEEMR